MVQPELRNGKTREELGAWMALSCDREREQSQTWQQELQKEVN
jgi:hypothetical protein